MAGCPRTVIRGGVAGVWAHEIDHLVTSEARGISTICLTVEKAARPANPRYPATARPHRYNADQTITLPRRQKLRGATVRDVSRASRQPPLRDGRAAIPWEIYNPLGRVIAIWGQFELRMDLLTQLIGAATKTTLPYERNFKNRKQLCCRLIKSYFAPHPDIATFLDGTLTLAAQAQWKRNLLVHGKIATIATWIVGNELQFGLKASGRHNGKDITLEFYADDFDQLYGDLAHCYGRFDFLEGREVNNPMLSSQDRQRLLDFVLRNLPNLPTPPTLARASR